MAAIPQDKDYFEAILSQPEDLQLNAKSRFSLKITYGMPTNIDPETSLPETITLLQNYPNPFNPATQINYALPEAAEVTLNVYNLMGQRVATLVSQQQSAGNYSVTFNAEHLASGVYQYRLSAGGKVLTQKMTLVK
ncbi:MAG: T9SS type A sorting domain-containing protein [Balneolales bacterium]|nr:T9SS type A sorting domain-containing protein [Balneolales bacterium]